MSTGVWGGKGCDLPPTGKEEEQQGAGDSRQCRLTAAGRMQMQKTKKQVYQVREKKSFLFHTLSF